VTNASALTALYRAPEPEVLAALAPRAQMSDAESAAARETALALIAAVRASRGPGWIDAFLQEYALGTEEGLALLALAEAYLRIPDGDTAARLVSDKVGEGRWSAHLGQAGSLPVDAATLGLVLTRALMDSKRGGVLRGLVRRAGEPLVLRAVSTAMQLMGAHFVLGRTIEEALDRAGDDGLCSFDMLGEGARTFPDADRYFASYLDAIGHVARVQTDLPLMQRHAVSVKLSALHPRYSLANEARAVPELAARLVELAAAAARGGVGLTVDAEEAERLEISLDIFARAAAAPQLAGWDGLGLAVQAYQKRAGAVLEAVSEIGAQTKRRIPVRLVKGAYWDTEIKHAQQRGLPDYPVFTRKAATDVSNLACARQMLATDRIAPAFATHNAMTVSILLQWIGARRDVEFQRLHGMGEALYEALTERSELRCRIYAPVGGYRDLLAYLVRRLLENGANSSFVHQLADEDVPAEQLSEDPVAAVRAANFTSHPAIPKPADLYAPERPNSQGIDMTDRATLTAFQAKLATHWHDRHTAAPIIDGVEVSGEAKPVRDPADTTRIAGTVVSATRADVARAAASAAAAAPSWSAAPVATRADALRRAADSLEQQTDLFAALAVREAGKTLPDAIAEVREAVDFCRYYAAQAEKLFAPDVLPGPTGEFNELTLAGRGVFACISPWNFPLAIFTGQVAAALVTGNSVLAKPAPQTPLIAAAAVRVLHQAGVPKNVLHLLPGDGEIGGAIVADRNVAGVAFTGSTATARRIARTLLEDETRPIAPLVAETGGINAMIVDSSALPEQVADDVLISAFQSAGQRCSALRLLCVQDDVADRMLEMITGAASAWRIGDPGDVATDIGPLIDEAARTKIEAHLAANKSRIVWRADASAANANGWFLAPAIVALDAPNQLQQEVFGPVLHVVRWNGDELPALLDRINAARYGLTMGLHSRIRQTADLVRAKARVGNLYVNRTMIGAVVGSQPFGGEGLSGTGPKAGGPHYLLRFANERALCVDTTSAGGNARLMSEAG